MSYGELKTNRRGKMLSYTRRVSYIVYGITFEESQSRFHSYDGGCHKIYYLYIAIII